MKKEDWKGVNGNTGASAVYGLGLIGALVYFIQGSTTLIQALLGVLKAIFWPAIVIYKLLEFLRI